HTLPDGRLLPLPGERLAPVLKSLIQLLGPRADRLVDGKVKLHRAEAGALAAFADDTDKSGLAWAASAERLLDLGQRLKGGVSVARLTPPESFKATLRPYQADGMSWLGFLREAQFGGVLADDMGLGKTATTLAHLATRPGPHLVVCPLSVVHNWEAESRRFTPKLHVVVHHGTDRHQTTPTLNEARLFGDADADLVVTTYGLVARDASLAAVEWSTVVIDEAQMIKNPGTRAAKAIRALRAGQKLALTGTPVENRLAELWAILDAVNPGLLGGQQRFRERYGTPIERRGDAEAAARLRRITQPFVLRRTKADKRLLPDLPDKIEQIAYAQLTREQAVLYQHVVEQLMRDAEETTGMQRRGRVLAAITRLKQICNHPAHALRDGSRLAGRSGKLDRFDELVDELLDVDERALVFTQFREMGDLLQLHLAERLHIDVPFLHGGVARGRRDAMVRAFQDGAGPPLLLVSLKAGGTGLNLTAADHVFLVDPWWNPAVEDQATDRAWRIGQHRTVNVHKLVCEGTVEERIGQVIDEKRALADAVVGTGEAWLSELSTDELRELVALEHTGSGGT
ncbi:MAG TPA: DEAD/DEAH box helicase, partial [Ilumatobacteraceae bacterium]